MGRDPYRGTAERSLRGAQKKLDEATRTLSSPAKNAKATEKNIESAQRPIAAARDDAERALQYAQSYVDNAKHDRRALQDAKDLLAKATAIKESLDDAETIRSAVNNPRDASSQRSIREAIVRRAKDQATDSLADSLMEKMINYATFYKIEWFVSAVTSLPPGTPTVLRWTSRAAGELGLHVVSKAREKYVNRNPNGSCRSDPKCHMCQRGRTCQYL